MTIRDREVHLHRLNMTIEKVSPLHTIPDNKLCGLGLQHARQGTPRTPAVEEYLHCTIEKVRHLVSARTRFRNTAHVSRRRIPERRLKKTSQRLQTTE